MQCICQVWRHSFFFHEEGGSGYIGVTAVQACALPSYALFVRVDIRRLPADFPPSVFTRTDEPRGGWWNWGGIVREVELRPVDRVDFDEVEVVPQLGCAGCAARARIRVVLRNVSGATQRVTTAGRFGTLPVRFRAVRLKPGATRE